MFIVSILHEELESQMMWFTEGGITCEQESWELNREAPVDSIADVNSYPQP